MAKFNWRKTLSTIAPILGTAYGGPWGALAGKVIGKALVGKDDASEAEISDALETADPELLLKLKNADNKFKTDMAELDIDFESEVTKRHVADASSDDKWQKRYRPIIALSWNLALIVMLGGILLFYGTDEAAIDLLKVMFVPVMTMVGTINVALFGSRGAEKITRIIQASKAGNGLG